MVKIVGEYEGKAVPIIKAQQQSVGKTGTTVCSADLTGCSPCSCADAAGGGNYESVQSARMNGHDPYAVSKIC